MAALVQPYRIVDPLTPDGLRAQAKNYRDAAAQSGTSTNTGASYLRLAARCDRLAEALEAREGGRAEEGQDDPA
jgi:hypothetical protein